MTVNRFIFILKVRFVCLFIDLNVISRKIIESIKFILKPKPIYHVNQRDQLILPCVIFGNPKPMIKWFKVRKKLPISF